MVRGGNEDLMQIAQVIALNMVSNQIEFFLIFIILSQGLTSFDYADIGFSVKRHR